MLIIKNDMIILTINMSNILFRKIIMMIYPYIIYNDYETLSFNIYNDGYFFLIG